MATFVISTVRCTLSPLSLTQCSVNDIFRAETIRTLNRRTVKVMTIIFPASINEIIKNKTYRIDSVGMSVSKVLLFEDMVLKIQPENEETQNEHLMMEWLDGKLPVPKVICHEIQDGMDYLLMTRICGKMSCADEYLQDADRLAQILASGLTKLWSIDISDCPCNMNLDRKLKMAEYNVKNHLVDMDNVDPQTFGENGFKNPEHLLDYLCTHRPPEDLVLSHGDFCLPNIILENGRISGFIDLGKMGIADRWQDIALCYRSFRGNCTGKYHKTSRQFPYHPDLLFEKSGITPDWDKINYYLLLDELF